MPSTTTAHYSNRTQRPIEATMIQGDNIDIGCANLHMTIHQDKASRALDLLRSNCSLSALVDAKERYDPPRCAEATRRAILQKIEDWALHDGPPDSPSSIFWLYGGAGAGKSALAQTLAEKFKTNEDIAASFFFFRADMNRNDGNRLIPTLVLQLAKSFSGLTPFLEEKIVADPDLFSKNRQTQMLELLIEPLIRLSLEETNSVQLDPALKSHPRLVVIDGLDECSDPDIQFDLLRIIASAVPHLPYPLRFLITSRPESHITHAFQHDLKKVARCNLSDDLNADEDIRIFLEGQFAELCRTHRHQQYLPPQWPPLGAISSIVERSSGHFIYAATVIRFIQSPKHRPDHRLQVILGLKQPYEKDRPYALLDSLYSFIFLQIQDSRDREKIRCALGVMHLRSLNCGLFARPHWPSDVRTIETLLELEPGELYLLFDPLLSLVAFDSENIRIYHKSLFDYLLDSSRSEGLEFHLKWAHESTANHILRQNNFQDSDSWDLAEFQDFAYHCQFAHLDDGLKDHLRSLACHPNITFTKSFPKSLVPDEQTCLLQSIFYFLQVIGRQDFDPSGHCYWEYIKKETQCLRSAVPWGQRLVSMIPTWMFSEVTTIVKRNLCSSFGVLSPNLNTFDLKGVQLRNTNGFNGRTSISPVSTVQSVVEYVKQEHEMFSSYLRMHRYPNTVVSFLKASAGLIHSCHFVIQRVKVTFMMLVTYTEHGVRLSCTKTENVRDNTARLVQKHFRNTQNELNNNYTKVHSESVTEIIACIGPSGSGKSRIIDCLAKTRWASNSLAGGALEIRSATIKVEGSTVVLIDTPGFQDISELADSIDQIERWLKATYKTNERLTGILFLYPINWNRPTNLSPGVFQKILESEDASKIICVTTMWDRTQSNIAERRERSLHSEYWEELLRWGALTDRFDGTEMAAWRILHRFLDN